ncbi:hypothetical protein Droror1_Dr00016556 [Drosera rotundifolia]
MNGDPSPDVHVDEATSNPTMTRMETLQQEVSQNGVMVFGRKDCCMVHVVKRLLLGLGANPPVFEVADEAEEALLIAQLKRIIVKKANDQEQGEVTSGDSAMTFKLPAVFVGGELFGGLERVMATHISGELVPILRQAGALWL